MRLAALEEGSFAALKMATSLSTTAFFESEARP
jgi:hypothetical protein